MSTKVRRAARRPEWEDGGGIDDRGQENPVPDPQLPLPPKTLFRPGSDKVATLAARHAAGLSLWNPADLGTRIDYIQAFSDLGTLMREEHLAERGYRWLANCISIVPGPTPDAPPQYRAQVWDTNINDHIEIGRATTRADALDLVIDWARRALGLDLRYKPPQWIKLLMPNVAQLYAEQHGKGYGHIDHDDDQREDD